MQYRETWDLSSIPDDVFNSELGRRNGAKRNTFSGGRKPTCTCGKCPKCAHRERQRQYQLRISSK